MVTFIAQRIKEAYEAGLTTSPEEALQKGQAKYTAYFGTATLQRLYGKYESEVDAILTTDGYEECIVPYVAA